MSNLYESQFISKSSLNALNTWYYYFLFKAISFIYYFDETLLCFKLTSLSNVLYQLSMNVSEICCIGNCKSTFDTIDCSLINCLYMILFIPLVVTIELFLVPASAPRCGIVK